MVKKFSDLDISEDHPSIVKIQSWYRGCIFRLKHLPNVMYSIKNYLEKTDCIFTTHSKDGRINSCIGEEYILEILSKKFNKRIKKPNIRMWYDFLVFDYIYGWLPVNIKITTTNTNDNIGNLATCVYAYTDQYLDIHRNKTYHNGEMSDLLFLKLKNRSYNFISKKDYYFLVLNKTNPKEVIVNSIKGLSVLTPNINNLPFQVCWSKNKNFRYENISKKVKLFVECVKHPKPGWKEIFLHNMRTL